MKVHLALDSGAHSIYERFIAPKVGGGASKENISVQAKIYSTMDLSFYHGPQYKAYVEKYVAFVKKHVKALDFYVTLDIIFDPKLTWESTLYLESCGIKPMPVFHYGEDHSWFKKYIERYEYVGVGGLGQTTTKGKYVDFANKTFGMVCNSRGMPQNKIHGFAMGAFDLMLEWPWYCMTEEHQVLTKTGWKGRDEIKIGELVLAYKNGKSHWQRVLEVPKFKVKNTPIIHLDNRTFSARVTSNHRWLVNKKDTWRWRSTEELVTEDHIPRRASFTGFPKNKKYSDAFVELAAWTWTDGSMCLNKNGKKRPSLTIYQSQSANPMKCDRIRKALKTAKEKFYESRHISKTGGEDLSFELRGHVKELLFKVMPTKNIPLSFILDLTREQLNLFIQVSILGDGCVSRCLRDPKGFDIGQKNGRNLEVFRIACLLAGYATSVYPNHKRPTKYPMQFVRSSPVHWIRPGRKQKDCRRKVVNYSGTLWCLRVKDGAFFTRCNNKIYVTGNSVDASSPFFFARMGSVVLPSPIIHHGKVKGWNYFSPTKPFAVTERRRFAKRSIEQLPDVTRRALMLYFEELGFTLEQLQEYTPRDVANLYFFLRATAEIVKSRKEKLGLAYPLKFYVSGKPSGATAKKGIEEICTQLTRLGIEDMYYLGTFYIPLTTKVMLAQGMHTGQIHGNQRPRIRSQARPTVLTER